MTVRDVTPDDMNWLEHAARLSRRGMEIGQGGPFGALVVRDGRVVGEGWNEVTSDIDPTAHAEVNAIRRACKALASFSLRGCTIYSSCEPCPMCLGAIYWARLDRLIFANSREEAAAIGFDDVWIYNEIPKPLSERILPTLHLPHPEAKAVFDGWILKPDKVPY